MFWIKQVLIALDQLINTLLGGWADETLSSRAYRMSRDGKPFGFLCGIIDTLLWFDKNHCAESYQSELDRSQLHPETRNVR